MLSLVRFAVARPITTLMGCLMVVLLGTVALTRLPIDLLPDITYPTVTVTTLYEGAGPAEIETLITRPLEQTLGSVHGLERLMSSSYEGISNVRVQLRWGTNIDEAMGDARAKVEMARRYFPQGVQPPYVQRYDVSDSPIIFVGLTGDLDPVHLTRLAEQTILPRLESVDGVARVRVRGGLRREIQVNLDRTKIEALNLSVAEVVDVLRRENVNQPAGSFSEGDRHLLIRPRGEFRSLAEIGDTMVREHDGANVRIRDIANIVDGTEEQTEVTRVNSKPGLLLSVFRQAGFNAVDVSDNLRRRIDEINASLTDAELAVRIDRSEFIRQSVGSVKEAAISGMVLTVLILVLFLQNVRSTLVVLVSMPLSILATFVMIYLKGYTLNMISFGGLALGIGMLVDNSIVVLESIFCKRDEGLEPKLAAIEGTREVATAILASTLTTTIVFVPLIFIEGLTGVMLHQMAWVVSFSLFCSLIASLTVTPTLAAYWLGRSYNPIAAGNQTERDRNVPIWRRALTRLATVGQAANHGLQAGYQRLLGGCLRHAAPVGVVLTTAFALTIGLVPRIGSEFFPKTDEGDMTVMGRMAPGIHLDRLDADTRAVERVVNDSLPERATTSTIVGGTAEESFNWNRSYVRVALVPRSRRSRGVEEVRKDLESKIGKIPGMEVRVVARTEAMLAQMLGAGGSDIVVEVRGHQLETAEQIADNVENAMHRVPGLVNIEVVKQDRRPELAAIIDRAKAGLLGVSVREVTQTLETTIRGTEATVYREGGDEFKIRVRLAESDRNRMSDVEMVGVSTPGGRILPVKNLVSFRHDQGPVSIERLDRQRVLFVAANVEDRDLQSAVGDLKRELNTMKLPENFSIDIAGAWKERQRSFDSLQIGFVIAVLLMYMVMASQYESLLDPLLILVTLPLAAIGVILMLLFTGTTFNVQSYIGCVMLSGIVVNNAIMMVDYFQQLRRAEPDADVDTLIVRSGGRRLRPVLMTKLTAALGMLPMAFGWGEGGEFQAPLARALIGGLTTGTLITLLAVPLLLHVCYSKKRSSAGVMKVPVV
jgi:HAE1 family hydrophobic/amphiphilic exporter-1